MSQAVWQQYMAILTKRLPLLLVVSFVAAAIAYTAVTRVGSQYQTHFSYLVSLTEREDVSEFRFDGFYALQATDLFTATLATWSSTPEVVIAAHEEVGLTPESRDPRTLGRIISAQKTAPQLVQVTVKADSPQVAEELRQGLIAVMDRNVQRYHDEGIPALQFAATPTESWTGEREIAVLVIVVTIFIVTLLLLINAVLLIESIRAGERNHTVI